MHLEGSLSRFALVLPSAFLILDTLGNPRPGICFVAGLYFHVPFRTAQRPYDDAYYDVVPNAEERHRRMRRYVDAVCRELRLYAQEYASDEPIRTIHAGGGRPSLMSMRHIRKLLNTVLDVFDASTFMESTAEVNPADASLDYLQGLRGVGFDRLSIEALSFYPDDLRTLNAPHTAGDVIRTLRAAEHAGFTSIAVDLAFGWPGQSGDRWRRNLRQAIDMKIPAITLLECPHPPEPAAPPPTSVFETPSTPHASSTFEAVDPSEAEHAPDDAASSTGEDAPDDEVGTAPADSAPADSAPADSAPADSDRRSETFHEAKQNQEDPSQEDPAQKDPAQEDPAQEDPAQEDPADESLEMQQAKRLHEAMRILESEGYEPYELTHFAKPGHPSHHLRDTYAHGSYIGVGPSAESFWWPNRTLHHEARRWTNVHDTLRYAQLLDHCYQPIMYRQTQSLTMLAREYIFLRLRTADGLDLRDLNAHYGEDLRADHSALLVKLVETGLVHPIERETLRLTPSGRLVADAIIERLLPG